MAFLENTEHFDSLNRLAVKIDDRKKSGAARLSRPEQVLDLIWSASGVVENGSFQYFFECGLDAFTVAQAYDDIGMPEVAALYRKAGEIEAPVKGKEWPERLKLLCKHEEELDALAMKSFEFTQEMELRLFKYVTNQDHPLSSF